MGLGNQEKFLGNDSLSDYDKKREEKRRVEKERADTLLIKRDIRKTENNLRHKEAELKRMNIKQREMEARATKLAYDIPQEENMTN